MKVLKILIIIATSLVSFTIIGQNKGEIESYKICDSLIEVKYERTMLTDTFHSDKCRKDILTLLAGNDGASFYSEARRIEDRLISTNFDYMFELMQDEQRFEKLSKLEKAAIFRFYADNKTIVHQRYDLTNWLLEETTESPVWEIRDSTCNVLGIDCIEATTSFRGREWYAYFAPEIPIKEGPWKLRNLPGLILKAYDKKGHYIYEAKEIDFNPQKTVDYYNDRQRIQIKDRIKGLKYQRKVLNEDLVSKVAGSYGLQLDHSPSTSSPKRYYYDFEETDYPHD